MEYFRKYESPIGTLTIRADASSVTGISTVEFNGRVFENDIITAVTRELDEYFSGRRFTFNVPINPRGTPFQLAVWEKLMSISYGKTESYTGLAAQIGNKNLCRAVGNALNKNPILILIPCHRIIGKNGSLTGFASGLAAKQFLLSLEKEHSNDKC